ncbi:MAG: RagB/SusD family nutrient uptake outer membrane protein [Gemmatimonadaceae bacterium]|nr:RagB/SusD family nutrient uptake outer membrane protein [Gemmatimonadaceae bacterium]MCC6431527.1 RagB/SusD family nutrient uptake outer membrane protein [Gemmatimonadaceae bacterium]
MHSKLLRYAALAVAVIGLGACDEELAVANPNAGETARVLGTAADAEALLGTYYRRWSSGVYGSTANLEGMANVQSLMNYSSLANNCQNARAPFSGAANSNAPGNVCAGEQYRLYQFMGEVNRVASSFLGQVKGGLTLGTPARDARAKAYAEFLRGLSIGYVSLMYDSGSVVTDETGAEDAGELVSYKVLADSSNAAFQRAIDLTNLAATGSEGFPLPTTWIPSPTSFTKAEFVKLIRSYRARFRANVARTPAERATVDWAAVVADAQNGITADHLITTSTTLGPGNSWRQQYFTVGLWHQMPPFFIGMADVSGAYATWIAKPLSERGTDQPFFMVTPDLRFPQGTTRAAQNADFAKTSCNAASTVCKRYFENRVPGGDQNSGLGLGLSNYDFVRFQSWNVSGDGTARNGNTPFMTKAEVDLLQAEGLYRQGNFAAAGALVNITRTRNGLPAITTFDANTAVPGGATDCVPKVPVAPFNVVACGKLLDALKYEKRIETAYTHYAPWFLDGRGWGELPKDTPLFWAVPYQDLQARGRSTADIYGTGPGPGNAPGSTAATSVYGW